MLVEKIKYLGNDMNLKFTLNSDDNFLGFQQEIDNLTQGVGDNLINPTVDVEERRFKYKPNIFPTTIKFLFTQNGNTYLTSLIGAGFTGSELTNNSQSALNSFYILNFYDTYDVNTQTKILSTYLTKVNQIVASYSIDSSSQFYYLYIPISYINTNIELVITGITGYSTLTFYNAKKRNAVLFFNQQYSGNTTPLKMYFPTFIDFINKTWNFVQYPTVTAKQLWSSQEYINKVNDNINEINNESQTYPDGSSFRYLNGKYFNTQ